MHTELIINDTDHETRVALLEDSTIVELFIERGKDSNLAGNIYKGRVQRVLPGMQAAFVDIGIKQAAFIYVKDVISDFPHKKADGFKQNDMDFECKGEYNYEEIKSHPLDDTNLNGNNSSENHFHIEELLKNNQDIFVQIAKAPIGSKGARVTSHISIPGRFLVLMPTVNHVGVSRRIESEKERQRLKDQVESLRTQKYGFIVRTAGEGVSKDKIQQELFFLSNLWENIQKKYQTLSAPALLHKELSVTLRAVRDLLTKQADKLIIDSRKSYIEVLSFLDDFMPGLKSSVEFYNEPEPIFDAYNIEGDISRALKKKVWLKSGGYIIIEHTEALISIDVNTGRYVGKHNFEETILKTNLEAVKEIAYQIRLRNVGGIIIIDFIDMNHKSHKEKVFNAFKNALKKDKSKTHVLPLSELGIIQMTRKRVRKALTRQLCEPCFYCIGEGYLISKQSICYNIYREIITKSKDMTGIVFSLYVNPEIANLLHNEESKLILSLERKLKVQILVYPNSKYHLEEFDIFEIIGDA